MTKIYIARHGQDKDNAMGILNGHRDTPLTNIGINQAKDLAQKIKTTGLTFDLVYSSPLKRARRTAQEISKILKINKPVILDQLIERDFGVMTGELIMNIEKMCAPKIIETKTVTYFLSPKKVETFPQALKRAKKVLNYIKKENKDQNVLLVTHGDFGKMLYAAYYKLDWKKVLKKFHFGNSDLLLLSKNLNEKETHVFAAKQFNN